LFLSSETRGPALELYLDENRISAADAASGIPVDPGSHVLEATQEGKLPWKTKLSVPEGAKRLEVAVPALEDPKSAAAGPSVAAPPALGTPAPDTAHAPTSDAWPTIRKVGVVSIVLGTIGVGVGTVFGMQALSEARIASKECPKNACSKAGLDAVSAARSNATISTVSILGGVGLAVVGGVLVWSKGYSDYASHPKPTRNVALTPIPAGWMVGVEGTF
jgi:hypothetical protein